MSDKESNKAAPSTNNLENERDSSPGDDALSESPQNTSSSVSTSAFANTPGDSEHIKLSSEPIPEPTAQEPHNVKAEIFFREDAELPSVEESKTVDSLSESTANLCHPPTPPVDENRPPDSPAIPPRHLSIPVVDVSEVVDPLAATNTQTGTKPKGSFGGAFSKLVGRLSPSPRKEKSSTPGSDSSVTPESSISADASKGGSSDKPDKSKTKKSSTDVSPSCKSDKRDKSKAKKSGTDVSPSCSSDKPKTKKPSKFKTFLGKEKSPKNSPDKKKSPSKLKGLVQNALKSKKKMAVNEGEASELLCDIDDPPKTKSDKTKRSETSWDDVAIPKGFKKEVSINFSDTTVDSLSTQCSQFSTTTDSPLSDKFNTVQLDFPDHANPDISPIPESPESPESKSDDENEKSEQ